MKSSSRLRLKLAEVRKECEVMMLRELKDARMALEEMQIRLEEIQITGKDTNSRVQENQERWRRESESKGKEARLSDIRRRLHLKSFIHMPNEAWVAKRKATLNDKFSRARHMRKRASS